ncbi:phosphotransferase family protein [Phenylobacterium sp.]|uniref:phosphotransferase family protein n=1 Tax=Phenylobacterium sp. TaxID=1871053 RepID=UPI002FE27A79
MRPTAATAVPETAQPAPTDDLDGGRLESWLARAVEGYAGPLEVRRFAGGQSNPTYQLITPHRRYVLRRKPAGPLLRSAHAVDREFRAIRALRDAGYPVPQAFALCDDDSVIGSMFYVMEMVEGRILWDGRLPDATPTERAAIYDAQIQVLARLHVLEPQEIGLADFGPAGNYYGRQVARWTKQYRASEQDPIPEMDRLIDWLPRSLPPERPARVVHGDFRLDNMVFHPSEPRVVAVLDWELSTLGDPIADLTYLLMQWVMPPGERNSLLDADLAALGIPDVEACLARYGELTGQSVDSLDWCFAYNLFRLAAILQGVAGRFLAGNASSERAARAAGRVRPLAMTAWQFALKAGARG